MEQDTLTLKDFLMNRTGVLELCIIREDGWRTGAVWIDNEDLWKRSMSSYMLDKIVKKDEWGVIQILGSSGLPTTVPCHYIDV